MLFVALGSAASSARPMPDGATAATPLLKPNIVFFLTDDQTFESLGRMPYLNANSWIRFDNAWIENALCCPSRATILQGRYDTKTGVGNNKQGSAGLGNPFFLFFAPTATHGPWRASPMRTGMFNSTPVPLTPDVNEADVSDKPAWIQALTTTPVTNVSSQRRREWAAGVSVDDALAGLDAALQASGVAENTVVVFMTDNGYSFAQHRYSGKMCEYAVCSRTPLLVRYPGVTPHSVPDLVSNVDIASTLADIGGATPGISQDGRSLLPLILGLPATDWRDAVLQHWTGGDNIGSTGHGTAIPAFWAVRSPMNGHNFAYVELATGEKELYDELADPYDLNNVAGLPQYATEESSLAERLAALKAAAAPPSGTQPFYRTGAPPANLQIAPDD